jgi:flavin-dependent dehydrogenase
MQLGFSVFDVIISGAGPAGSVAATLLARGGARVLVLDRARFPRDKLCGDTVNPGTLAALRRLGLAERIESHALPIRGMLLTGERRAIVRGEYGGTIHGLSLLRRDLDGALLDAAVRAGARVEEGVLVRAPLVDEAGGHPRVRGVVIAGRDGHDIRIPAPLVIAADGRRSPIALALRLARHPRWPRRWAVGAYFDGMRDVADLGEMHVRQRRYVGVAPVPSGLANVCVVTATRTGFEQPARLLERAVADDWYLGDRFASARLASMPVVLGPLAVDVVNRRVPGLLLAGDAAGFIDPITGDGLRFAVCGAELAATVALRALERRTGDPQGALVRLRRRAFAAKWCFNRSVRRLVATPSALNAAGLAAAVAPSVFRRVIAFAGDVQRA